MHATDTRGRVAGVLLALVVAAAQLAVPRAACAQQPPQDAADQGGAQARAFFTQGVALSGQERWGEALECFRRSRALVERPSTVYNIGTVLVRLGRMAEAVRTFEDYLRLAGPTADPAMRADTMRLMREAQAALATVALELIPANATVTVDGRPVPGSGSPRDLTLDPGDHAIEVTAPGYQPRSLSVSLLTAARVAQSVELAPAAATAARGRLEVQPRPADAVVSVDGHVVLAGDATELAPGSHTVDVSARGYGRFRATVTVRDRETTRLPVTLAREANRGVLTSPAFWATIAAVVVVGTGVGIGAYVLSQPGYYGGSTNQVLQGEAVR